jgi:hypothetical protein
MSEFNEDIKKLINKKIMQIAIGEFQIQLNMESDFSISIEKTIDVEIEGKKFVCNAEDSKSSEILLQLNGLSISESDLQNDSSLVLKLSNGTILKINCIDDGNESYQINLPDDTLAF